MRDSCRLVCLTPDKALLVSDLKVKLFAQACLRHLANLLQRFFFLLAGCNGSRGFWQSLTKRESLRKKDIQSCVANRALPK